MSLLVEIEFCINCHLHNSSTRHDEAKYLFYAEKLMQNIQLQTEDLPEGEIQVEPMSPGDNLIRLKGVKGDNKYFDEDRNVVVCFPRLGSFEVYVNKVLIFSKLQSNLWPSIESLTKTVLEMYLKNKEGKNLKTYELGFKAFKSSLEYSPAKLQNKRKAPDFRQTFRIREEPEKRAKNYYDHYVKMSKTIEAKDRSQYQSGFKGSPVFNYHATINPETTDQFLRKKGFKPYSNRYDENQEINRSRKLPLIAIQQAYKKQSLPKNMRVRPTTNQSKGKTPKRRQIVSKVREPKINSFEEQNEELDESEQLIKFYEKYEETFQEQPQITKTTFPVDRIKKNIIRHRKLHEIQRKYLEENDFFKEKSNDLSEAKLSEGNINEELDLGRKHEDRVKETQREKDELEEQFKQKAQFHEKNISDEWMEQELHQEFGSLDEQESRSKQQLQLKEQVSQLRVKGDSSDEEENGEDLSRQSNPKNILQDSTKRIEESQERRQGTEQVGTQDRQINIANEKSPEDLKIEMTTFEAQKEELQEGANLLGTKEVEPQINQQVARDQQLKQISENNSRSGEGEKKPAHEEVIEIVEYQEESAPLQTQQAESKSIIKGATQSMNGLENKIEVTSSKIENLPSVNSHQGNSSIAFEISEQRPNTSSNNRQSKARQNNRQNNKQSQSQIQELEVEQGLQSSRQSSEENPMELSITVTDSTFDQKKVEIFEKKGDEYVKKDGLGFAAGIVEEVQEDLHEENINIEEDSNVRNIEIQKQQKSQTMFQVSQKASHQAEAIDRVQEKENKSVQLKEDNVSEKTELVQERKEKLEEQIKIKQSKETQRQQAQISGSQKQKRQQALKDSKAEENQKHSQIVAVTNQETKVETIRWNGKYMSSQKEFHLVKIGQVSESFNQDIKAINQEKLEENAVSETSRKSQQQVKKNDSISQSKGKQVAKENHNQKTLESKQKSEFQEIKEEASMNRDQRGQEESFNESIIEEIVEELLLSVIVVSESSKKLEEISRKQNSSQRLILDSSASDIKQVIEELLLKVQNISDDKYLQSQNAQSEKNASAFKNQFVDDTSENQKQAQVIVNQVKQNKVPEEKGKSSEGEQKQRGELQDRKIQDKGQILIVSVEQKVDEAIPKGKASEKQNDICQEKQKQVEVQNVDVQLKSQNQQESRKVTKEDAEPKAEKEEQKQFLATVLNVSNVIEKPEAQQEPRKDIEPKTEKEEQKSNQQKSMKQPIIGVQNNQTINGRVKQSAFQQTQKNQQPKQSGSSSKLQGQQQKIEQQKPEKSKQKVTDSNAKINSFVGEKETSSILPLPVGKAIREIVALNNPQMQLQPKLSQDMIDQYKKQQEIVRSALSKASSQSFIRSNA